MRRLPSLFVLLPLVTACGAARDQGASAPPSVTVVRPSPGSVTTRIVGATPRQRQSILGALSGIGPTELAVIELHPAEKGWSHDPQAVGVEVTARSKKDHAFMLWQSWLVANVLASDSANLGLQSVAYVGEANGGERDSLGDVKPAGRPPNATSGDRRALVQQIEKSAKEVGAVPEEVRVLRPRGLAVVVTLRVSDPAQFLAARFSRFETPGPNDSALDRYLRVVDSNGKTIVELARARLGEGSIGSSWVRPDLIGCYDPAISHPMDWKAPPCPGDATTG